MVLAMCVIRDVLAICMYFHSFRWGLLVLVHLTGCLHLSYIFALFIVKIFSLVSLHDHRFVSLGYFCIDWLMRHPVCNHRTRELLCNQSSIRATWTNWHNAAPEILLLFFLIYNISAFCLDDILKYLYPYSIKYLI